MNDVDVQSAKLCVENGLLMELNIRCSREAREQAAWAHSLQAKLTEIEQCLSWCSENVVWCGKTHEWTAAVNPVDKFHSTTLYQALHAAWSSRKENP